MGTDPTNSLCDLYYESNTTIPQEDTREYATTTEPITSTSSNGLSTATVQTVGPSGTASGSDSYSSTPVTAQTAKPVTEDTSTSQTSTNGHSIGELVTTASATTQADMVGNIERLEGEGVWRSLTVLSLCVSSFHCPHTGGSALCGCGCVHSKEKGHAHSQWMLQL